MPRQMSKDLEEFQLWLMESRGISGKASSVYASKVRKILNQVEVISPENLDNFIKNPMNLPSRDLYLSSWKRFVEFMRETLDITIPPMKRPKANEKRVHVPLSPYILEMAYYLKDKVGLPYQKILSFQWKDFHPQMGGFWELVDPFEHAIVYRIPANLCRDLCEYSFRDEDIVGEHYIIPLHKGSPNPNTRRILSLYLRRFTSQYLESK